jgi:hypothetical protein
LSGGWPGRHGSAPRCWAPPPRWCGSLVTHPAVWWLNDAWAIPGGGWWSKVLALVCRLPVRRALGVSAAVNAFSFGVGLLLSVTWLAPR